MNQDPFLRVTLPQNSQQVSPAEWRRFRVELLKKLTKGVENESSVREHLMCQLLGLCRLVVVKYELRVKKSNGVVRLSIPRRDY